MKVLPQAFTDDPDRLARFEREAKVLASLNHPNIGHIYGLEEAEGQKALVLELVEGPTLADRIAEGPIPIDEALAIAKRVEEALEAAHEHGLVHGDLTLADVKVTNDGHVKVLGFGCGRVASNDPQVDTRAFEALCEFLLGMKTLGTSAARPVASQETGPGRRPIPLAAWIWSRRLATGLISFALAAGLLSIIWPKTASEPEAPLRSLVRADRAISPDGRWLAYASDETGRFEILVRPSPDVDGGSRWQITTDGGTEPVWSPDGRELFYRNGNRMLSVAVDTSFGFEWQPPKQNWPSEGEELVPQN